MKGHRPGARIGLVPRGPVLLRTLLMKTILKRLVGGEVFLILVILLAEIFSSVWRFLALEVAPAHIALWALQGMAVHGAEVLPVAYLFAITLTLAEMHADGELLVVFGSGISVQSLNLPVVLLSFLLAAGLFFANDALVIPVTASRDSLYKAMTGQKKQNQQIPNITIMAKGGSFVYRADFYVPSTKKIVGVDVVGRDGNGVPTLRILAPSAQWSDGSWRFADARVFYKKENGEWTEERVENYARPDVNEDPESFAILTRNPKMMKAKDLSRYIKFLKSSGLPSAEAETEYHKRFSFLLTPLIVCGISIAFAGLFRKNSLLMSLLFSLGTATIYYVAQMLGALSAKTGWLQPFWGIWGITIIFLAISLVGFFRAKT